MARQTSRAEMSYLNEKPLLSDLCNHVRTNRWYQLGIQLDIDLVFLNDIQVENLSEEKRRSKMFEEWLRVNPKASVRQLIEALRKESVQENLIAHKMEKIYQSRYNGIYLKAQCGSSPVIGTSILFVRVLAM